MPITLREAIANQYDLGQSCPKCWTFSVTYLNEGYARGKQAYLDWTIDDLFAKGGFKCTKCGTPVDLLTLETPVRLGGVQTEMERWKR